MRRAMQFAHPKKVSVEKLKDLFLRVACGLGRAARVAYVVGCSKNKCRLPRGFAEQA